MKISELKTIFNNFRAGSILFRPFVKQDTYPLFKATREPTFNDHLLWSAPDNEADLFVETAKLIREHNMNKAAVMSVVDRQTGTWTGFVKTAPFRDSYAMSLWVHPDWWKKTTGFWCAKFTVDAILNKAGISHMYAYIATTNLPMQAMCEKFKFKELETVPMPHADGYDKQMIIYRLDKDVWQSVELIPY